MRRKPDTAEREFYLRDFRHRCIVVHASQSRALAMMQPVLDELEANPTMVALVVPSAASTTGRVRVSARELSDGVDGLADLAVQLMANRRVEVIRPRMARKASALAFSCTLARRLGAGKLVIADPRGGIPAAVGTRAFANARSLAALVRNHRRLGEWTRAELKELLAAVRGGVDSVNLTRPEDLEVELFTYEGAGTLLTAAEYCTVEPLRIDEFAEARRLLLRGEEDGFLLARNEEQRTRLLLCAFGAWFDRRRLAGVAGLETAAYRRSRVAEITGLYTITRFQGEGVGVRIIDRLVDEARNLGLRGLFACTSNPRAAVFFERHGFQKVPPSKIPAAKWKGRPRSAPTPACFWRAV